MLGQYKKILVTGASGFLGQAIADELAGGGVAFTGVGSKDCDLRDKKAVAAFIEAQNPDLILHLAADCGGIYYNVSNPASILTNNLEMTLNLFEAVKNIKTKMICIGSVDSYPKDASIPYGETSIWDGFPEGTSAYYGLAKRMNLAIGEAYFKQYGVESTHILLMNLFGPYDHFDTLNSHVIPAIITKIDDARKAGKRTIEIFGDGTAKREFIFVRDAAKLIIDAAEKIDGFKFFNMGSGCVERIIDVIEYIMKEMKWECEIVKDFSKPVGHPIKEFELTRMREALGTFRHQDFYGALSETVSWYLEHVAK